MMSVFNLKRINVPEMSFKAKIKSFYIYALTNKDVQDFEKFEKDQRKKGSVKFIFQFKNVNFLILKEKEHEIVLDNNNNEGVEDGKFS